MFVKRIEILSKPLEQVAKAELLLTKEDKKTRTIAREALDQLSEIRKKLNDSITPLKSSLKDYRSKCNIFARIYLFFADLYQIGKVKKEVHVIDRFLKAHPRPVEQKGREKPFAHKKPKGQQKKKVVRWADLAELEKRL